MSIFRFSDSRAYLRAYIAGLPKKGRGEARRLAGHLGVSTTLISQVLSGKKSLTPEQAQRVVGYLGLPELERDYFLFLVQSERAGSVDVRTYWQEKLREIKERAQKISQRVRPERILSDQERSVFYSSPIYSAVRLYTSVGPKGKSMGEICERFGLTPSRGNEILRFLRETGLCALKGDRYVIGPQSTHLEHGSPHLARHHTHWRVRAIQRSESLTERELMYTAPVSLSEADFAELRESMVVFIKAFLDKVHASPAEEIACFNLDFFWIKN